MALRELSCTQTKRSVNEMIEVRAYMDLEGTIHESKQEALVSDLVIQMAETHRELKFLSRDSVHWSWQLESQIRKVLSHLYDVGLLNLGEK
jgi:uncharacterized Zn finger protein